MRYFVFSLFICLLVGCATPPKVSIPKPIPKRSDALNMATIPSTVVKADAQSLDGAEMDQGELFFYLLRREFSHWQGTPYRFGGDSKKGIDCSALVQHIYRDSFNISLPRTTQTQVNKGVFVYRNKLQVGDLVFFKTGHNSRHVGIYMGNDEFIHVSTSKGVITSSLNNVYWKPRYWQAKRILE